MYKDVICMKIIEERNGKGMEYIEPKFLNLIEIKLVLIQTRLF